MVELTQLKPGKSGTVIEIQGGHGMVSRLHAMGIRPGKKVKKISSHFWRGPHTVEVDRSCVAIGYGMASKIFVEVDE